MDRKKTLQRIAQVASGNKEIEDDYLELRLTTDDLRQAYLLNKYKDL